MNIGSYTSHIINKAKVAERVFVTGFKLGDILRGLLEFVLSSYNFHKK